MLTCLKQRHQVVSEQQMLRSFKQAIFGDVFVLDPLRLYTIVVLRLKTVHKYLKELLLVVREVIFCFTVIEVKELGHYLAVL